MEGNSPWFLTDSYFNQEKSCRQMLYFLPLSLFSVKSWNYWISYQGGQGLVRDQERDARLQWQSRKKSPWLSWRASRDPLILRSVTLDSEKTELINGILRCKKTEAVRRFDVLAENQEIWLRVHNFFVNGAITHANVYFSTKPETRSHWHISCVFSGLPRSVRAYGNQIPLSFLGILCYLI